MFYKKGIHIGRGHEREMFEFLQNHFRYDALNSWNNLKSIANNVKIYNLRLPYSIDEVLDALGCVGNAAINAAIKRWESRHPNYAIGFNGRSDGYIVLYNRDNFRVRDVCEELNYFDSYEDAIREKYSSTLNYILRPLVEVVRDFDKFCDELRVITAYITECFVTGSITEEESCIPLDIEYDEIPKDFRKKIENS